MELFELILLLLLCVAASSVVDQVIPRMSLPLIQIAVGAAAAVFLPHLAEVHVDSELFLTLFIAPLLFHEARETDKLLLWNNRWSVLSMAIALVVASVLAAGFILNLIIPSIPLAAAFACAAALGPTDAAAVAALGSTVSLTKRQSILLSGESLINDASGVVSFQFAVAAAITGAFSVSEAISSFSVLFFGGIIVGALMGFVVRVGMKWLRERGYVNTVLHVMYEVLTPFLFFLHAEGLHVSGILAVVAAGIVMQEPRERLSSPERARHEMVSGSIWEVIVFIINGIIFVMLGMQLPKVMNPEAMGGISPAVVIMAMLAVLAAIIVMRFIWVSAMELICKNPETGIRGAANPGGALLQALVTTIAGAKGAVTLSIIMTMPLYMQNGDPFPQRDLIIFLTSGVILCTLLLADFLLPKLSPKEENEEGKRHLDQARILVLEGVVRDIRHILDEYPNDDFTPAVRLTLMRYRNRLMRERFTLDEHGGLIEEIAGKVLDVQQKRADEIQQGSYALSVKQRLPYYLILPGIRASIGYFGGAENVGSRFESRKGRFLMKLFSKKAQSFEDEQKARVYYDTCIFAIDLEHAAINYLKNLEEEGSAAEKEIARMLATEHETALESLWGRINYGQDIIRDDTDELNHGIHDTLPEGIKNLTAEQFQKAWHFADEADANALEIELGQIRKLRAEGRISEGDARILREEVYLMQNSLME